MKFFHFINGIFKSLGSGIDAIISSIQVPWSQRLRRAFHKHDTFHWRKGLDVRICELGELFKKQDYEDLLRIAEFAVLCDKVYDDSRTATEPYFPHPPAGWQEYTARPDVPSQKGVYKVETLKFSIWVNTEDNLAVIVFRGTAKPWDWYTNARFITRFIPGVLDHYDQVVWHIDSLIQSTRDYYKKDLKFIAAGHSLGGGLAQQAAYAHPDINTVFAFNPSPVTGYRSVPKAIRYWNKQDLSIYRIYEKGEVLVTLRLLIGRSYILGYLINNAKDPEITEVRFNFRRGLAFKEHGMSKFAESIKNIYENNKDVNSSTPNVEKVSLQGVESIENKGSDFASI
jgi:hypothetical protein